MPLTQKALCIIQNEGKAPIALACRNITRSKYDNGVICEALHHYAQNVLPNVFPIFPALICLTSKVADGKPKEAKTAAASLLLITSAGDIHDDIVDNSEDKFGEKTLFGAYGKNVALLAGDVLMMQGITALQNSALDCGRIKRIAGMVSDAMTEIVKAEALEASLWRKEVVSPQDFFEVIKLKGCVAELHCRIGGEIAGGDKKTIESLACFGRKIGILLTLKEEFTDLQSPIELAHRIRHELPPYPILRALQDNGVKIKINDVIRKGMLSKKEMSAISKLAFASEEVRAIESEFKEFGKKELETLSSLKNTQVVSDLALILNALSSELTLAKVNYR